MKYLITLLFVISATLLVAQSPSQLATITQTTETAGAAANNPWIVGAKLSFAVRDLDGSLEDNFIFSGKATGILAQGENYAFPVYGSIGLGSEDIFSPESGFNAGLYPYFNITKSDKINLVLHGGTAFKVIPGEDEAESTNQFKVTAGLEVHFATSTLPITLSVAPAYLWHNTIVDMGALEVNFIAPVKSGVGVLAEYIIPWKSEFDGIFRIGIITVGIL